jgi:hypothetical protein
MLRLDANRSSILHAAAPLAGRQQTDTRDGFLAMSAAMDLAGFIAGFLRASRLLNGSSTTILASLESRRLDALIDGYSRAFSVVRTVLEGNDELIAAATRPASTMSVELLRAIIQRTLPSDATLLSAPQVVRFWADYVTPQFQTILEAMSTETGLRHHPRVRRFALDIRGGATAEGDVWVDWLSDAYHELVRSVYASIGIEYHAVRLYRDSVASPVVMTVLRQTTSAYPFPSADSLRDAGVTLSHGLILRVRRPGLRLLHPEPGAPAWEGIFEYAQIA